MQPQTWSIIVFGFNEAHTISETVEECVSVLGRISPNGGEVLIIDDGSSDNTQGIVTELVRRYPVVRAIRHEKNRGIGGALLSGYHESMFENCVGVPADGQFDVRELMKCPRIEDKEFISFERVNRNQDSPHRQRLSSLQRAVNWATLQMNLEDVNWVKAFKTEQINGLELRAKSALVESEICAKLILSGCKMRSLASQQRPRKWGQSRAATWKTMSAMATELTIVFLDILLFRFRKYLFSTKSRVTDGEDFGTQTDHKRVIRK